MFSSSLGQRCRYLRERMWMWGMCRLSFHGQPDFRALGYSVHPALPPLSRESIPPGLTKSPGCERGALEKLPLDCATLIPEDTPTPEPRNPIRTTDTGPRNPLTCGTSMNSRSLGLRPRGATCAIRSKSPSLCSRVIPQCCAQASISRSSASKVTRAGRHWRVVWHRSEATLYYSAGVPSCFFR